MSEILVRFQNVSIDYRLKNRSLRAVDDFSLGIERGKITAFVGESGSGKTTLVSALLQCISSPGVVSQGSLHFFDKGKDIDILALSGESLRRFRWEKIAMVFQASQSTLNPLMTIYDQFYETAYYHGAFTGKEAFEQRLHELFAIVKLDESRVLKAYPHQLSGGMKQRVMIAFALLLNPALVILDEPTTALDVVTQEYFFDQLLEIKKQLGTTMILLTHDIGVVAKVADNVAVIYAGHLMEYAEVYTLFREQANPYTRGLIQATPSVLKDPSQIQMIPGNPPDIEALPKGCPFCPRCPKATARCQSERAPLFALPEDNHLVRCWLFEEKGKKL